MCIWNINAVNELWSGSFLIRQIHMHIKLIHVHDHMLSAPENTFSHAIETFYAPEGWNTSIWWYLRISSRSVVRKHLIFNSWLRRCVSHETLSLRLWQQTTASNASMVNEQKQHNHCTSNISYVFANLVSCIQEKKMGGKKIMKSRNA